MARRRHSRPLAPRPSVPDPRPHLLKAVLAFVQRSWTTSLTRPEPPHAARASLSKSILRVGSPRRG
jgi:hypothetical protein